MTLLTDYGRGKMWCSPPNNHAVRIRPVCVTADISPINEFYRDGYTLTLPVKNTVFHCYTFSRFNLQLLSLNPLKNKWVPLKNIVTDNEVVIKVYNDIGKVAPLDKVWMLNTDRDELMLAVERDNIGLDIPNDNIYLDFYSSIVAETSELGDFDIKHYSRVINNVTDLNEISTVVSEARTKPGELNVYHNGYTSSFLTMNEVTVGNAIDVTVDETVVKRHLIPLSDMRTFFSTLDNDNKYIVHPNKDDDSIHYLDDVVFHLVYMHTDTKWTGLFIHRNAPHTVRMLTHRDYAIPTKYITSRADHLRDTIDDFDPSKLRLMLDVRRVKKQNTLPYESNHIHELYKMTDVQIVEAFTGIDSNVTWWRAVNLETCPFVKMMSDKWFDIDDVKTATALGFDSTTKLFADTPVPVVNGQPVVMSPNTANGAAVLEYDIAGTLKHVSQSNERTFTPVTGASCVLIESLAGQLSDAVYVGVDEDVVSIRPDATFACFYKDADSEWKNVTRAAGYYTSDGTDIKWTVTRDVGVSTFVMFSDLIHYQTEDIEAINGVYSVTLKTKVGSEMVAMAVLNATFSVWINDKSGIEGLDYRIKGDRIYLTSKGYLKENEPQSVRIIAHGLSNGINADPIAKYGFVKYGAVSWDSKYDIRDDKVLRCVLDGHVKTKDNLVFAEDIDVGRRSEIDGLPYLIRTLNPPIPAIEGYDAQGAKVTSHTKDRTIVTYMTHKNKHATSPDELVTSALYNLYSPFTSKLIFDIFKGVLTVPEGKITDDTFRESIKEYESLLNVEPTNVKYNHGYTAVHAHPFTSTVPLKSHEYTFVERAIAMHLDGSIDLTPFVTIGD